jgi:hypothetical protein
VSDERDSQPLDPSLMATLPSLVRFAAGAWWRTAGWSAGAYMRAGQRVVRAAASGESPVTLLQEMRDYARELLGVMESVSGPNGGAPPQPSTTTSPAESAPAAARADPTPRVTDLRRLGAELLRQSADVHRSEDAHPAYARILLDLAPDEARILRFLYREGAQPSVDVRSSKTLNVTSQLVAPGLSMIGAEAGCRYLERVPAYLNNLYRLGLVWFSREPLEDPLSYQVLEAQPDVIAALRSGGRGKTVRRSIHLTPFGEDFCSVCLPPETATL